MKGPGYSEFAAQLPFYRALVAVAGAVYLLWWFAVHWILPEAANPLVSRLLVVAFIFSCLAASYANRWASENLRPLFLACVWLITLHYYYLFYLNQGDINWIVGAYITVIAINLGLLSRRSQVSYSIYVLILSSAMVVLVPPLRGSVFLPGLVTLLFQAHMGLRSRLGMIRVLGESNARFQLLFNSSFEGVMVHQNRSIVNANDALARMSGYSREELIGRDPLDIIHPDEREWVAEKMLQDDGVPHPTRAYSKNGKTIEVEVRAKNFTYDGAVARLVTIQDITDRKRAERERVTALAMTESVRIRDEFISIASHELKTPLSSLKLQAQMLQREMSKNTGSETLENLAEVISLFNRQTDRLTSLVETMLDVSQISTGRLKLDRHALDLTTVVREVVAQLKVQKTQLDKVLIVQAPEPLTVLADRGRIEQILENLLSNAFKYGEAKPVEVAIFGKDADAYVQVRDHGPGIAPQLHQRIFDRFERGVSPRNIAGLGLGLYIARQFSDAHGGNLSVESVVGEGSVFTLRLPLMAAKN